MASPYFSVANWLSLLLLFFVTSGLSATGAEPPSAPSKSEFPMLLWDVNFNGNTLGLPPRARTKEEIELREELPVWKRFPQSIYDDLAWVTPTRIAAVEASAFGLGDKPVVFSCEESAQPHYGPQIVFCLPREVVAAGKRYLLVLDVAKNNEAQMGGFEMGDVGGVAFREDGTVIANGREIAHYGPSLPLHFEVEIDADAKTVAYKVNGRSIDAPTMPWVRARGSFVGLRLHGLLPGGYAQAPGKIAFDNIKLTLLEIR